MSKVSSNKDNIEFISNHFKELNLTEGFDKELNQDFIYFDLDSISEEVIRNKIKYIDIYPKTMDIDSPYNILESFYEIDLNEIEKEKYLNQEQKFLRTILLISSYSKDITLATNYIFYKEEDHYSLIENIIEKEDILQFQNINTCTLKLKDYGNDYQVLSSLLKLSLRDRIELNIFMSDLNVFINIKGLFGIVYSIDNKWNIIEKICTTEGLYLREKEDY